MANILVIDDNKAMGANIATWLGDQSHKVDVVQKGRWEQARDEVIAAATTQSWDILILDIQYPTEEFGGIWLYNALIRKGLNNKLGRIIVSSKYAKSGWEKDTDIESLLLRVFVDTADIQPEYVLSNQDFNRSTLVEKCEKLLREGAPNR